MNYKGTEHATWNQRLDLERTLKNHFTKKQIALALGKCERSVYYEISRSVCVQMTPEYEFVKQYCPEVAEKKYQKNLRVKGPDVKIHRNCPLANRIEELMIDNHFSPGAVLAKIRNN